MPTEFISVKNPANDQVGRMSRTAFEQTFKDKGFTEFEGEVTNETSRTPEPTRSKTTESKRTTGDGDQS